MFGSCPSGAYWELCVAIALTTISGDCEHCFSALGLSQ